MYINLCTHLYISTYTSRPECVAGVPGRVVMRLWVYIHVYTCVCIYIYIYTYIYMFVYLCYSTPRGPKCIAYM